MSSTNEKDTAVTSGKRSRVDNYRLYRPEAVAAYSMRGAGEPWAARLPLEGWLIIGLTLLAVVAAVALYIGER